MPAQQFDDLKPTGLVERAPAKDSAKPKASVKAKSSARTDKKPDANAPAPTEPQSPDKVD